MCFQKIPVVSIARSPLRRNLRTRNLLNLRPLEHYTPTKTFSVGLWNCQSAVNKVDFIPAYASSLSLDLLALTETWLKTENTATRAALSAAHSFSHTPHLSKRGGGTGVLVNNKWNYAPLPLNTNYCSFEYHAIKVIAPVKCSVIVIYRPPGPLGDFINELDTLLSSIPELKCPLLVLGDFNIHLGKAYATDFLSLINSFDMQLVSTPPTHKNGNQLDLILTKNCKTDDVMVTPLHTTDHFFIRFMVSLPELPTTPQPMTTSRRNLRNLSAAHFASVVAAALPPPNSFSPLDVNAAAESLSSTLTACLDTLCPLFRKPARSTQPRPWLTDAIRSSHTALRAAERKWHKSNNPADLEAFQSLLMSFSSSVTTAKMEYYNKKISSTTDSRKLLSSGVFPAAFKQARVTPRLKKTTLNPALVENYRPVSLLPFLSKTIERAVSKQVTDFLAHHHLLDPKQSGFRSGHSTETALLSVTEALKTARTRGQSSVLILHDILLATLANMGITGTAHSWLESYLAGRSFNVSWQGRLSLTHTLSTGVPQGSVLGPLLFAIYTTSLSHVIRSHGFSYHCYADDTQLYLSFQPDDTTVSACISASLSDLSTWMKDHHLQLNLSKTELLVIPAHESICHDINLKIGTVTITPNHAAKNLGVLPTPVLDDRLSFSEHISSVARSCRYALYNTRRIRPYLTQYAAQFLIQATVTSRLDHCNSLRAGLPACAIKSLQMVQNAAARLVFNQPKRTHVTTLFSDLHWLPVAARIKHKALTRAYKTISGSAPVYLSVLLKAHVPTRALRSTHTNRLVVPSPLAKRGHSKLFSVVVPKWWNDLPTATRTATSLSTFKKLVKTFLFQDCFPFVYRLGLLSIF
ncbi:uncharacterized protein LOC109140565 [Larimichthys crocea]|uniref:uncharacterized protein LOC109140565 n=1 Tax=Larimichthys crocea TaxID=215358 RepID=UPI000F603B6A|nr:uncharacterized protein LOC109140565 [Larimichthys crocea]